MWLGFESIKIMGGRGNGKTVTIGGGGGVKFQIFLHNDINGRHLNPILIKYQLIQPDIPLSKFSFISFIISIPSSDCILLIIFC